VGPAPAGAVTIDLGAYRRVRAVDRDRGRATVEAGISLRTLGIALGAWGLSLENGGGDPAQALGAAVSLGAHGTGAAFGGLATQVTAMQLVTPDGTLVSCSADEEQGLFDAARVGLGALGVVSTVTLRCGPGFNLCVHTETVDLDQAIGDFDAVVGGNDHVELSWRAGRRLARVTTANRTDAPADGGAVDRGYRWFNRKPKSSGRAEYSFPRRESGPALREARARGAGGRVVPFPITVTVTAGDAIPLSPAEGRPSLYIAGVAGLDGRPQWGTGPHPGDAEIAARYPRFTEWRAVRDRFGQSNGQG
jgi:L-gulonolactone oxidase